MHADLCAYCAGCLSPSNRLFLDLEPRQYGSTGDEPAIVPHATAMAANPVTRSTVRRRTHRFATINIRPTVRYTRAHKPFQASLCGASPGRRWCVCVTCGAAAAHNRPHMWPHALGPSQLCNANLRSPMAVSDATQKTPAGVCGHVRKTMHHWCAPGTHAAHGDVHTTRPGE